MNSYIACTFALIAALAYVSADAVTTSEAAAACTSGFKVKTYTNGVYALKGNTLVTTPGDNSDLKVVNEGGKFYLKLGNKYFCDSTEPIHGGYKVTACDKKEDSCEIQIRRCDAVGDRLAIEKPQPDCTTFYFPKTRHYLSAGVPDNLNQAVQSQDWCRTWEYSYLTCPAPTPSYGGGNGYGPPGGHGGYGPKNPSGNAGGYGGGNPGGNGGHGGGAGGYGSGQPKTPPAGGYGNNGGQGGYGGGNPGGNGGHGGAGGYGGGQPKTPPAGGYGSHGGQGGYSGGNPGGNGGHGGAGGYSGGQPKTPPAGGQGGYGGGQPKTPPAGGYGGGSSGGQGGYGAGGHGNGGGAGGYTSSQGGYGGKAPAKGGY